MGSIEEYRRKAAELVLRAGKMTIPEHRAECLATPRDGESWPYTRRKSSSYGSTGTPIRV
jgi:hypothetical protein